MRDSTCDAQTLSWFRAVIVVASVEVRIETNGFNLRLSESDLLGCGLSTPCDYPYPGNSVRVHDGPLPGTTTTHRATSRGAETLDSTQIGQLRFGTHGISKGQKGKARAVW